MTPTRKLCIEVTVEEGFGRSYGSRPSVREEVGGRLFCRLNTCSDATYPQPVPRASQRSRRTFLTPKNGHPVTPVDEDGSVPDLDSGLDETREPLPPNFSFSKLEGDSSLARFYV